MTDDSLSRIGIVLCRAGEAGNVGSVCRAMKTMGIERLVLAGCPSFDEERVRTLAVHAFDVYREAQRFPDLESALMGFSRSAGFTRRRGSGRKNFSLSVADFARRESALPGSLALVFGNEQDGLSGAELDLCSLAVHIPTSDAFPSLNLAQAVQIACYEFHKEAVAGLDGSAIPVERREVLDAVERMSRVLADLGFFRITEGTLCRTFLRDTVERAGMTPRELRYFEGIFHKMAALSGRDSLSPSEEPVSRIQETQTPPGFSPHTLRESGDPRVGSLLNHL